jgi:ATP-dependent 26S proteasome regulatory subunit
MGVDQLMDIDAALIQLVRLAVSGRREEMAALARSTFHGLAKKRPDLKTQAQEVLSLLSEATPTRMKGGRPVPVDTDSRLELLRIDHAVTLSPEPVWPVSVKAVLETVVAERHRQGELSSLGLEPTRSMLFTGLPGVGKTLAARWLAIALERPLLTLDLAAVMSSFLGRTGNNIRVVLEYAKQAPSVLLLDEFDAIAKRRDDATEVGELKRLVTVLLQEIDEWPSDGLLIAATNHPEMLDPAVWRRFDHVLEFPLPSRRDVRDVLRRLTMNELDGHALEAFAAIFDGKSFSDISRELSRARRRAVIEGVGLEGALRHAVNQLSRESSKEEQIEFAKYLDDGQHSQREISELTGISRATLRKYGIALRRDEEGSEHGT